MSTGTSEASTAPGPDWRPKAVVFDLLTGLLDSWSIWNSSVPASSSSPKEDGRRWREEYLSLTFSQGAYVPYEDLVRQSATNTSLPPSASESLIHNWPSLRPWPEVPAVLVQLRQQGYLIGVVTNCSKQLGEQAVRNMERFVSAETGTEWTVDAMVTAEESGWYKPAREAYDTILPRLTNVSGQSVGREDILFVAGSAGDVQGSRDAGFWVVWNNHVGMHQKGSARPLREGRTLDQALQAYLE